MKFNIVAETYEPHEMGQIAVNKQVVFMGNFWDFHPGCSGTEITIGYKTKNQFTIELEDVWDGKCSPKTLASLIGMKLLALGHNVTITSKERKTPINC